MFHRHISACNLQLHRIRIKFRAKSVKCGKATHHPWSIPGPQDEKNPMDPKQIGFWWFLPHGSGAELRIISSSLFLASYSAFGSHLRSPSWSFRCFFLEKEGIGIWTWSLPKGQFEGIFEDYSGEIEENGGSSRVVDDLFWPTWWFHYIFRLCFKGDVPADTWIQMDLRARDFWKQWHGSVQFGPTTWRRKIQHSSWCSERKSTIFQVQS